MILSHPLTEKELNEKKILLVELALKYQALRLNPESPFQWTSGYFMPIYNDNRLLNGISQTRSLITEIFIEEIKKTNRNFSSIIGIATGGIAPAAVIADRLKQSFAYVRSEAKSYGLKRAIEGHIDTTNEVLIVEDLVSTGTSSLSAIQKVREAGFQANYCFCVFNYNFAETTKKFQEANCILTPILTYNFLLEVALSKKLISKQDHSSLLEWYDSPFTWGEKNGFPKVG